MNTGNVSAYGEDAEHDFPYGETCAAAVNEKEITDPPHTFWENDSETLAEPPAPIGFGKTLEAKSVLVSPISEVTRADVPPVLLTPYTKSKVILAQFAAVTRLMKLPQSTDGPPEPLKVHLVTATCERVKQLQRTLVSTLKR